MTKNIKKLNLIVNKKVFIPTGTSTILIDATKKVIKQNKKILDLGCGSGVVGITLAKDLKLKSKIYFSDISKYACKNTMLNCKRFKIKHEVKIGSTLDPWKGYKFDYIISDVAALTEKISKVSPWYKDCINNSGDDGTRHIISIIRNVKNYLNDNGIFLFPIISLSNELKILKVLKKKFKYYKKIKSQRWPMPHKLSSNLKLLYNLKKKGVINFENKLGMLTFKTDIYIAKNK
jgi:methylase of polypeptide subunit release factors